MNVSSFDDLRVERSYRPLSQSPSRLAAPESPIRPPAVSWPVRSARATTKATPVYVRGWRGFASDSSHYVVGVRVHSRHHLGGGRIREEIRNPVIVTTTGIRARGCDNDGVDGPPSGSRAPANAG
jgi:hypothetical protein